MYICTLTDHLLQLLKTRGFFALEALIQGHLGPVFPTALGNWRMDHLMTTVLLKLKFPDPC